jgi:hypothetical protein
MVRASPRFLSLLMGMACALASEAAAPPEDKLTSDLRRAWELLNASQQEEAVRFVDAALEECGKEAQKEALTMRGFAKPGRELEFHKVNIAGTLGYVRALAFQRSGKRDEWLAALRRVWTDFPFCQAWDPKGWWWKPGEAAKKEGYVETIAAGMRDRTFQDSPFPADEDALDYPQMSIALASVVSQTLEKGDYAALEYLASRLREMKLRFPDGSWVLPVLYRAAGGAAGPEKDEASWERTRERLAAWKLALPDSVTAQVAEAHRLISYAWHVRGSVRGSGFVAKVKAGTLPVFGERIETAKGVLEKCPRTCPAWYAERLMIARAQSETRENQVALFQEGWKAHPGYTPLLEDMVVNMLPRWRGVPGDWLKLAQHVAKSDGAKAYTLAVNEAWSYERATILEVRGFEPALYRKGWLELLDEHKGSLSLAHRCLLIALSLKDSALTTEAFRRVGQRYHPSYWSTPDEFFFAKRRAVGTRD